MNKGVWIVALLLLRALPAQADAAAQKLLDCMHANIPDSLRIQSIELTATDRSGADRVLRGKIYAMNEKGLSRAMLRIEGPPDLSGAAYLMRESASSSANEIFFFLPAMSRVRRISGSSADASLLGTDFSYNDMKEVQSAFSGSQAKVERAETLDQRGVQVLALTPLAGATTRYSGLRAWIDNKSCIALKVEFYEAGALRKLLTAPPEALQQSGKYWYLSEMQMRDMKENTKTQLKVVGVNSGGELPSRLFDPHSFYLGN